VQRQGGGDVVAFGSYLTIRVVVPGLGRCCDTRCSDHALVIATISTEVEGEHHFVVAQEVKSLEMLEPEAGAAGGIDFDHPGNSGMRWEPFEPIKKRSYIRFATSFAGSPNYIRPATLQFAVNIWQRFQMPARGRKGPPACCNGSNESIQLHLPAYLHKPGQIGGIWIRLPGLLTRGHLISDWYFIGHYLPWAPADDSDKGGGHPGAVSTQALGRPVDPFRAEHDPARPAANQSVLPVPPKCAPGRTP